MKISASIPDPLWNDAQTLGDGPSDIVQNAIRRALEGRATTRPPRIAIELDEEQQTHFKVAAAIAHSRVVSEYKRGYAFGLNVAGSLTSVDAETLEDRTGAVVTLRDLIGSFDIPVSPERDDAIESPNDVDLLTRYAEFDGRLSIHLFLHVRSTVLSVDEAEKFGFRIDPRLFDGPDEQLEALWATSGVSWDLSGYGDGYARVRISRRYADGAIDAMLAVWDAAQTDIGEILGGPNSTDEGTR